MKKKEKTITSAKDSSKSRNNGKFLTIYDLSVKVSKLLVDSVYDARIYIHTHTHIQREEKHRSGRKALLKKSHAHAYNVILVHTYTEEHTESAVAEDSFRKIEPRAVFEDENG